MKKKKIILLGANGYMGSAFAKIIESRDIELMPISRSKLDYTNFDLLRKFLINNNADFVINAAGFTGKPNVDACELNKADTLMGNTLLVQTIAQACDSAKINLGHISSGCIYSGAKINNGKGWKVTNNINTEEIRQLISNNPHKIEGFTESDCPNFSFRDQPCSFYSGTKALAEEVLKNYPKVYIWRLRIPFDENCSPRNYITKLLKYKKVYDNINSLSHRSDFTNACLDLWIKNAPFGIYNVVNPGFVSTRQVIKLIEKILKPKQKFEFWINDDDFYKNAAKTPRSNCILDTKKISDIGIKLCNVDEAIIKSLKSWN